jgi:hypothetical protein
VDGRAEEVAKVRKHVVVIDGNTLMETVDVHSGKTMIIDLNGTWRTSVGFTGGVTLKGRYAIDETTSLRAYEPHRTTIRPKGRKMNHRGSHSLHARNHRLSRTGEGDLDLNAGLEGDLGLLDKENHGWQVSNEGRSVHQMGESNSRSA